MSGSSNEPSRESSIKDRLKKLEFEMASPVPFSAAHRRETSVEGGSSKGESQEKGGVEAELTRLKRMKEKAQEDKEADLERIKQVTLRYYTLPLTLTLTLTLTPTLTLTLNP